MAMHPEYKALFKGSFFETDVPMDRFTNFRVGGPADLLFQPETVEDLVAAIKTAQEIDLPVTVIGGGSNILISDRGIRGLVLVLTKMKNRPELAKTVSETTITALAGESLSSLCRISLENGLSGLEWAAGIPGTLGGAIAMNAGSFGSDIASVIQSLDLLGMDDLECRTVSIEDLNFSYRHFDKGNNIILKAVLSLLQADTHTLRRRYEANLKAKKASQPVSKASGGCFFKNPSPTHPAGRLIEQAGLKGYRFQGAMVSDHHANFIINHDHASCSDILALKRLVQDRVYETFGIRLEEEVKTIGQ
ncbi:MAG: UDP-N-acetylenolpyruvoylglucosamine reductase [Desulfobacterales bacterium]|nr:MAG: UDP-N-acetylenolpyruvoylglucosamine reductase [Desulfobacterales bacterium]